MTTALPPVIAAFIQAQNDHDSNALAACFADDAVLHDDWRELRGTAAIKEWSDWTNAEYQPAVGVTDVARHESEVVLTATVAGTFDGSPTQFHYHFNINGDKIAALRIGV